MFPTRRVGILCTIVPLHVIFGRWSLLPGVLARHRLEAIRDHEIVSVTNRGQRNELSYLSHAIFLVFGLV